MKDIVKLKESEIVKKGFTGNFISKDKKDFLFFERFANSLFVVEEEGYGSLYLDFEKYLLTFFDVCSKSVNKPSFIYINGDVAPDKIMQTLGNSYYDIIEQEEIYRLNKQPAFYIPFENDNYDELIERFIQERSATLNNRELFIILDNVEKLSLPMLDKYVTLGRSRNIYFIILIANKNLFIENNMQESFDVIKNNCMLEFSCSYDKINECKVLLRSNSVVKVEL